MEAKLLSQVRFGADLAKEVKPWPRMQAVEAFEGSQALTQCLTDGAEKVSTWPSFMRELFGRLYTGDKCKATAEPRQEGAYANQLHATLDELPEWKRLVERCWGDTYSASLASLGMGERLQAQVPEHACDAQRARRHAELFQEEYEALCEEMRQQGRPLPPEPPELTQAKQDLARAEAEAKKMAEQMAADASQIRNAARGAVQQANQRMDDIDNALAGCGWGVGDAGAGEASGAAVKAAVANRLLNSTRLREIFELAGRMQDIMRHTQASKVRRGAGELTDIEAGNSISRLLPTELMLLKHPKARYLLARKLHEASALQYHLEDREPKGKGPIVVCIDDSGSMHGQRDIWAKAIALALLELARRQKRDFCFCTFSTKLTYRFVEKVNKKALPQDLIDALLHHTGGGTKFDPPLEWAFECIARAERMKEADVIFISDGDCRAQSSEAHKAKAKALGARVVGIAVGHSAIHATGTGTMQDFCDVVHPVTDVADPKEGGGDDAARAVFSI